MSRLDTHVAAVRRKLTIGLFLECLAMGALVVASAALLGILIRKIFDLSWPFIWIAFAAVAAAIAAAVVAYLRRPSPEAAAVEIDRRLGLKERFSTALLVREWEDPFARAASYDAESAAGSVRPTRHFRLQWPRAGYWAIVVALLALLSMALPTWHRRSAIALTPKNSQPSLANPARPIEKAIERIEKLPQKLQELPQVKEARTQLQNLRNQKDMDASDAARRSMEELAKVEEAIQDAAANSKDREQAERDLAVMRSLKGPDKGQDDTAIADAHRNMSQGQFEEAAQNIEDTAKNFDKMTDQQRQAAADQMKNLGQQLKEQANDQRAMERLAEDLQQMGASPEQIQQAQDLTQKAAQGDRQAMQNVQNLQQQMANQQNNGQGADKKQLQQLNNTMDQALRQASSQCDAKMLSELALQAAQVMGKPEANPMEQQAQLVAMAKDMQDKLEQMANTSAAAKQMAEAQDAMQQAMADAAAECNGGGNQPGSQPGDQPGVNAGSALVQGSSGGSQPQSAVRAPVAGGGPGRAGGKRSDPAAAQFTVKKEKSVSKLDEKGKFLSRQFIQGESLTGESKLQVQRIIESSAAEAGEDIDDSRADPRSREVQKDYFKRLKDEAK